MDVLAPRTLAEALRLKAEQPSAQPIQGGTDLMVALNFDRARPEAILDLNGVGELRGWSTQDGSLRLGSGLTYTEVMRGELAGLLPALAEASRTVGSPQIRNRGTIGGNLGTSSPAGDALPPLTVAGAEIECASVRGVRRVPVLDFITGVKRNALDPDELITAVWLTPHAQAADVHEGRAEERDGDRRRLAVCRGRRRAASVVRIRVGPPGARHRAARGCRIVRRAGRRLPPRRSTTCAGRPVTAATPCGC